MPIEEYHRPSSVDEALDLVSEHDSSLEVIAGGTITMKEINDGHRFPDRVMGLRSAGLDYADRSNGHLVLGSTLTLEDVLEDVEEPLLREAAEHCAGWSVRNQGTVGGNLFAPPPHGDFAVALLALDADVKIESQNGERVVSMADFYTGPGQTAVGDDELVTEIQVPSVTGETAYVKMTRDQEPAPAIVTVAANVEVAGDAVSAARVAVNGGGPHPVRLTDAEEELAGGNLDADAIEAASEAAAAQADPFQDPVASDWYRTKMIEKHVSDVLADISEPSQ
jgi:CO/xanthine dehydrogenase FAD-binding subunit